MPTILEENDYFCPVRLVFFFFGTDLDNCMTSDSSHSLFSRLLPFLVRLLGNLIVRFPICIHLQLSD